MAFRIEKLINEADFRDFRAKFIAQTNRDQSSVALDIPMDYFLAAEVYGVRNEEGHLIAGAIINAHGNLRLPTLVPEPALSELKLKSASILNNAAEITCVWRLSEFSKLSMSSCFWPLILWKTFNTGKTYMLGHHQNSKLAQTYTYFKPIILYSGLSTRGASSQLFVYRRRFLMIAIFGFWWIETPSRFLKYCLNELVSKSNSKNGKDL